MPHQAGPIGTRIQHLTVPLRGSRVDLVPYTRDRIPELVRLMNDRTVARWTTHIPHPYAAENARWWVGRATRDRRRGVALSLGIVRRSDGSLMGGVGLHQVHEAAECAEVGYWLGRPFRGQGFATEAVNTIVRAGFERLRLHRIEALIFLGNASSRAVLRRCGFRYEGRIRDEVQKEGRWYTTLLFARLSTDRPVRARPTPAGGRRVRTQAFRRR